MSVVDLDDLVCPDDICPSMSQGLLTFRDDNHLSDEYAKELMPEILDRLRELGVDLTTRSQDRS